MYKCWLNKPVFSNKENEYTIAIIVIAIAIIYLFFFFNMKIKRRNSLGIMNYRDGVL
jgi:hypothetical protein